MTVFQFEAAIEQGREGLVHHMEVFHCEADSSHVIPLYDGACDDVKRTEATRVCKRVLAAWAYGAGPFVYPKVQQTNKHWIALSSFAPIRVIDQIEFE